MHSLPKSIGTIILLLITAAAAGDNEVIYLNNCLGPNGALSTAAYYSAPPGSPGQLPDSVAQAPSNPGQTTLWEGGEVFSTFPDGNTFTVSNLIHDVNVGAAAGSGKNKQSTFTCYREDYEQLYSTKDGVTCNALYSCSHIRPKRNMAMIYHIDSNYVTLTQGTKPEDVFSKYWELRDGGGCALQSVPIGDCTISFDCFGIDGNWAATDAFGHWLNDYIRPKILKTWITHETLLPKCHRVAGEVVCDDGDTAEVTHFSIPAQLHVELIDKTREGLAGQLKYTFTCPARDPNGDCSSAALFGKVVTGAGIIPIVGPIFAALGSIIGISTDLGKCA